MLILLQKPPHNYQIQINCSLIIYRMAIELDSLNEELTCLYLTKLYKFENTLLFMRPYMLGSTFKNY